MIEYVEYWSMVANLILPALMGLGTGAIFGCITYYALFSDNTLGIFKSWHNGIKVSPFLIMLFVGFIVGIMKVIELSSDTDPIYKMWAYVLGSQMIVMGCFVTPGFGLGGILGALFIKMEVEMKLSKILRGEQMNLYVFECPNCKQDIISINVRWDKIDGESGFLYYCPKCEKRITKKYMKEKGCL